MKIVVLIKQILDPAGVVVRRDKERIFVNRESYIIASGDKNGLEAALQIKDVLPHSKIAAVSLGPRRAGEALREALAMGADTAYLLHDESFAQADLPGAARILAAAVSRIGPDLILAGRESGSDAAGQIGPRLAELLYLAQITDAHHLNVTDQHVQAVRRWGDGFATVRAALPVLVTIAPGANRPRYPHGAHIMNAYRECEVTTWDAIDLGLETTVLAPLTQFRGESFAPPPVVGERLRGEPDQIARMLAGEIERILGNQ